MLKKLSSEQIAKILEKLPENLRETFFSLETTDKLREVCDKYEIPAEKLPFIVNYVGQILLGIMAPEELEGVLSKEAMLEKDTAHGVSQQIYRYIFFPVKDSMAEISGDSQPKQLIKIEGEGGGETTEQKEVEPLSQKPDIYREPME